MIIRRTPEDFRVEEVLTGAFAAGLRPDRGASRTHVVYRLTKTSLTTPEATHRLAGSLGLKDGVVEYGGLKDKHAVTVQHVSIPMQRDSTLSPPEIIEGRGFSATRIGWSDSPVAAAAIKSNHFEIVVRDISHRDAQSMDVRASLLRSKAISACDSGAADNDESLIFVNYFGDQRFGSARHGQGFVARHLIRGDFETALRLAIATPARKDSGSRRALTRAAATHWGDWKAILSIAPRCPERKAIETLAAEKGFRDAFATLPHFQQTMYVEAYQSQLWNATARGLALSVCGGEENAILADDPFGVMVFPRADRVSGTLSAMEVPIASPEVQPREPWGTCLNAALHAEGLSLAELKVPGMRRPAFGTAMRLLFARAASFSMSAPDADEFSRDGNRMKRMIRFALPRGSYATVLLRALGN